jgi:hypothetical protein
MSGHDNSDPAQDLSSSGAALKPDATQEPDLDVNLSDVPNFGEINFDLWLQDGTLVALSPNAAQDANVNGAAPNAAGVTDGYVNQPDHNAFTDQATHTYLLHHSHAQPMSNMLSANADPVDGQQILTAPPAQSFDAKPVSNTLLANVNQINDQVIHTMSLDPALNAQPMSNTLQVNSNQGNQSPIDFGFDNDLGITDNDEHVWAKPYPAFDLLSSQYQSSPPYQPTDPDLRVGEYPAPPAQHEWPNLERKLFQQGGLTVAGADAIFPDTKFQVFAAENDLFQVHPQYGAPFQGTASSPVPSGAAPTGLETLAPEPASVPGATALTEPHSDAQSNAVSSVKDETKTKKPAPKKKTTSKAKQEAVKVTIHSSQLLISSMDDAKKVAIKRNPLEIVADDRDNVAAHPEVWVPKIAKALDGNYRKQAEDNERVTEKGRREFERWQKEHENKAWAILRLHDDIPRFAQACAYIFYKKVIEAHTIGLEDVNKTISNGGADLKLKCSERINAAIKAIEEYSIVKYDFLKQDRLEALAASPIGFVSRKVENMWVNYKKKVGTGPVKSEVDEKGSVVAPKAKSQGKRKRKSISPPPSDNESEKDYGDDDDESDAEFTRPTKRTRAGSKGE